MTEYSTIERSILIATTPDRIVPLLVDFRRWRTWSPWEGLDENLKRSYSGAPAGTGSVYEWSGNRKAGSGRMEITSVSQGLVGVDLAFLKPFKSESKVRFALDAEGPGTRLTWYLDSPKNLMTKVMGLFFDFEKVFGADLERGLTQLKAQSEAA